MHGGRHSQSRAVSSGWNPGVPIGGLLLLVAAFISRQQAKTIPITDSSKKFTQKSVLPLLLLKHSKSIAPHSLTPVRKHFIEQGKCAKVILSQDKPAGFGREDQPFVLNHGFFFYLTRFPSNF